VLRRMDWRDSSLRGRPGAREPAVAMLPFRLPGLGTLICGMAGV
jgi:hypothetical protein